MAEAGGNACSTADMRFNPTMEMTRFHRRFVWAAALSFLVGLPNAWSAVPSDSDRAEFAKWQKAYGGVDPSRDPVGWCFIAENFAGCLEVNGDFARADSIFREIVRKQTRLLGRDHKKTLMATVRLASFLRYTGHLPEAAPLYLQAATTMINRIGLADSDTQLMIHEGAAALGDNKNYPEAIELLQQLVRWEEKNVLPKNATRSLEEIAPLLRLNGQYEESAKCFQQFMPILRESAGGTPSPGMADLDYEYSLTCEKLGRHEEAISLAKEALQQLQASHWEDRNGRMARYLSELTGVAP